MTAAAMDLEAMASALDASDSYRVLRRFVPRKRYNVEPWNNGDRSRAKLGVYVDVEGTGLDTGRDEIIELSLVPFTYDTERGIVYDVLPALSFLEAPTIPITAEIQALTGITPEMVAGKRIDDAAVNELVGRASILFAHNARYDRQMTERRLDIFCGKPWSCTLNEVDWKRFGVNGGALGNILMSACGEFVDDAHRAEADAQVGVHILAAAECDGRMALSYALESARAGARRVCAIGSPMGAKDLLRARKYRALYTYGRFQYWYKDVAPEQVEAEVEWCTDTAGADPTVETITALDRYSIRTEQ